MSRPLRVAAISELSLGSHRAHAINVIKTAGGFARLGHETTLWCLAPEVDGRRESAGARLERYGESNLRVNYVDAAAASGATPAARFANAAVSGAITQGVDVVYARHFEAAAEAAARGLPTILETHSHVGDDRPEIRRVFELTRNTKNPLAIISTISTVLRKNYIERGADPSRVVVVPDGVDLALFEPTTGGMPSSPYASWRGPAIVYSGHLYDYKGIPTILRAAEYKPGATWHLVGGAPEDIDRVRGLVERLSNVVVHGHVDHADVPRYLWHADVLLLPPEPGHPSAAWTSPVKLGEYLASERPIVASRIPGLIAWVDEPAVRWFKAGDHEDLNQGVDRSLAETERDASQRVAAARARAHELTYTSRAGLMIEAVRCVANV